MINVKDMGAKGDGVHNDTAAIKEAIGIAGNSLEENVVLFPLGTFAIDETLVIDGSILNPVRMVGICGGMLPVGGRRPVFQTKSTTLKWIGKTSEEETPMVRFVNCNSMGCGMLNIQLDCAFASAHGLEIDRCYGTLFQNISVLNPALNEDSSYGVKIWASDPLGAGCYYNRFDHLYIQANRKNVAENKGRGLWLHGSLYSPKAPRGVDACLNKFESTRIYSAGARHCLELGFCDNNTFIDTECNLLRPYLIDTYGVFCNFENDAGATAMPNHNVFFYLGATRWLNSPGAKNQFRGNTIYQYETSAESVDGPPIIKSGFLHRITDTGITQGFTPK